MTISFLLRLLLIVVVVVYPPLSFPTTSTSPPPFPRVTDVDNTLKEMLVSRLMSGLLCGRASRLMSFWDIRRRAVINFIFIIFPFPLPLVLSKITK